MFVKLYKFFRNYSESDMLQNSVSGIKANEVGHLGGSDRLLAVYFRRKQEDHPFFHSANASTFAHAL